MPRRTAAAVVSLALASPLLLLGSPAVAAPVSPVAKPYDFNGDGFPEVVVGAPDLGVGAVDHAGGVTVLPASAKGVSTQGTVFTKATPGVPGDPTLGDAFGAAFASADLDHDGYADLAVGAPADSGKDQTVVGGTVTVLFGSSSGLGSARSYVITRAGDAEDDSFGEALVAADLDADGYADLAVGAGSADAVEVDGLDYFPNGSVTVFDGGSRRWRRAGRPSCTASAAATGTTSSSGPRSPSATSTATPSRTWSWVRSACPTTTARVTAGR